MHPHMIEHMKDVIHDESSKKNPVIIVTHNQYLLDAAIRKDFCLLQIG